MIYFTNATFDKPHMAFIGRWSPFHKGHVAIIQKKRKENPELPVLIMVRDTNEDIYSSSVRAEYIKLWMKKENILGTIMIIPNIEGVYWGREVGYRVGQVDVDEQTKKLSGTTIRNNMARLDQRWKKAVADENAASLLSPSISHVIDRGLVLWLTGCPSSGKTTISNALVKYIKKHYPFLKYQVLDGDVMRASPISQNTGYSKSDRILHLRKMAFIADMFANHGILVICAFVSPYRKSREETRRIIGKHRFVEIYVQASQKTRLSRDSKGLYQKAATGRLRQLTGYDEVYEIPTNPSILCDTDALTVDQSVHKIISYIFKP